MELIIKVLSGEIRTVRVEPYTTIGQLKSTIAPLFNASTSRLKLSVRNGHVIQLDNNQKTVSEYGLSSGSTVMLLISSSSVPFQVFVKNEKGQIKTYDISEDETVNQLMTKVYHKEGVKEDQQRLIYNGRQLEPGMKLKDYNITPESTIFLTLRLRGG